MSGKVTRFGGNWLKNKKVTSSIEHGGTNTLFNFMALLALSNAVAPAHFFHLM